MPFQEDFSVFTKEDEFGSVATIAGTNVNGILDKEYIETTINGVPVAGEYPIFGCAESDLPTYSYGTDIVVDSTNYKIRNWKPDGTGWTTLILEEQ